MSLRNHDLATAIDVQIIKTPQIAGTSAVTSSEIDMQANGSFDSVCVFVHFGTAAANNTAHVEAATASGGSFIDLTGSSVASGSNSLVAIDCPYVPQRYLQVVLARGTSTTVDLMWAIKYHAKDGLTAPASWTTNASYELHTWETTTAAGA